MPPCCTNVASTEKYTPTNLNSSQNIIQFMPPSASTSSQQQHSREEWRWRFYRFSLMCVYTTIVSIFQQSRLLRHHDRLHILGNDNAGKDMIEIILDDVRISNFIHLYFYCFFWAILSAFVELVIGQCNRCPYADSQSEAAILFLLYCFCFLGWFLW